MTNYLGKSILFAASAFRKLSSIYVFSYFPFGFEGRIWDLIVSVPDHCLSFYFCPRHSEVNRFLCINVRVICCWHFLCEIVLHLEWSSNKTGNRPLPS